MMIRKNYDNGSITVKKSKRQGFYIGDTIEDYEKIRFLGFPYSFPEQEMDKLTTKASEWGFDIKEYLPDN